MWWYELYHTCNVQRAYVLLIIFSSQGRHSHLYSNDIDDIVYMVTYGLKMINECTQNQNENVARSCTRCVLAIALVQCPHTHTFTYKEMTPQRMMIRRCDNFESHISLPCKKRPDKTRLKHGRRQHIHIHIHTHERGRADVD